MTNNIIADAYPLAWPEGRKRTDRHSRHHAKFNASFARARDDVQRELKLLLGGSYEYQKAGAVISTNIALRRDGLPLAGQRQPEDPGVAVYFRYKGKEVCFACDRWYKIEDNMRAVALTIEALRGIARWGTGDMVDAAFRGFTALPAPDRQWRDVLGVTSGERNIQNIVEAYRRKRSEAHPDRHQGNSHAFDQVQKAYQAAQAELGFNG